MKKLGLLTLLALFLTAAPAAQAQTTFEIGPRVGYEIDDLEELFIGADVRIMVAGLPVVINPTFDYYLVDVGSLLQLSGNALYTFGINNQVFTPYAGAGVGITRFSFDDEDIPDNIDTSTTEFGLNVIGGATFSLGNLKPFAQAQLTFGDAELVTLGGGVLFSLGGQ